jgi:hypothetical protein
MTAVIFAALALVAATVAMHILGLTALLKYSLPGVAQSRMQFWHTVRLLIGVALALCLIHVVQIAVWAIFYHWAGCLPDFESALYFSGVTYATVGYGDLVLPVPWRMLGPVEGLTGGLMGGLSTALFFAFLSRVYAVRHRGEFHDAGD